MAEAGKEIAPHIERFRGSKAEHSPESLSKTLGLQAGELSPAVKQLVEIGLLEELRSSWKVPMLYRDGLKITQGKAF